ncbi:MAG TPA: SMC-Scp complex subunit ScpB [bacterium]|nr:MAG: Segregation and condensation protein B [bacterium ADurb.Bin236]HOC93670.1 SMC-Scp complex subunit ScpB [bacterium]HOY61733.1 SMC-Scp complex subunit ScpB [bacterium]HPI76820.1 SMC-Scp complex subunit ScpB [bacterium]HPN93076.1 SMC-Scp complex subunit ScpB [bacterium]
MLTIDEITNVIEGILFLSPTPVKIDDIAEHLNVDASLVGEAMERLRARSEGGGLEVLKTAGGWEMATRSEYVEHLRAFFGGLDRSRLSRASLETMAIIAYQQPVTRGAIEALRGVNSAGTIKSLLDKGLIRISGREDAPGRPFLFSTTPDFLSYLGLDKLADLPPLETYDSKV